MRILSVDRSCNPSASQEALNAVCAITGAENFESFLSDVASRQEHSWSPCVQVWSQGGTRFSRFPLPRSSSHCCTVYRFTAALPDGPSHLPLTPSTHTTDTSEPIANQ